ncbi:hypothetical protein NL676_001134 [Syzygium grande]|nr:hypothetical protein NL676_001134 [Syzygium grande]
MFSFQFWRPSLHLSREEKTLSLSSFSTASASPKSLLVAQEFISASARRGLLWIEPLPSFVPPPPLSPPGPIEAAMILILGGTLAASTHDRTISRPWQPRVSVRFVPQDLLCQGSPVELGAGSMVNLGGRCDQADGRAPRAGHMDGTGRSCRWVGGRLALWVKVRGGEGVAGKKMVIPMKRVGQKVNLEVDILGKHVERLLVSRSSSLLQELLSCWLRWMNNLSPDIKSGPFIPEEEKLVIKFHGIDIFEAFMGRSVCLIEKVELTLN